MYIRNPATAIAISACLLISASDCSFVIAVKIGTDKRGSRITKSAPKEYTIAEIVSVINPTSIFDCFTDKAGGQPRVHKPPLNSGCLFGEWKNDIVPQFPG
jgi:hypothetical protein